MAQSMLAGSASLWSAMAVLYLFLAISTVLVAAATRKGTASLAPNLSSFTPPDGATILRAQPTSESALLLRQRVFSWWLIFPVVSVCLGLYPLGPWLLVLLICGLVMRELVEFYAGARWHFCLHCLAGLALTILMQWKFGAFYFLPLLAGYVGFFWLRRGVNHLLILLFLLCAFGVGFLLQLRYLPLDVALQQAWLFYLLALTALNDVAQFISGKLFGKQKIARRISPNKTWQGLAGGVLISALVSVWLGRYLQLASAPFLATLAVLLSLSGFAGDLLFSAAKRFLGIKDFSRLIPGHGGMLDRVDSLVLTAPLLYLIIFFSH